LEGVFRRFGDFGYIPTKQEVFASQDESLAGLGRDKKDRVRRECFYSLRFISAVAYR
jgi:hypothetical protein